MTNSFLHIIKINSKEFELESFYNSSKLTDVISSLFFETFKPIQIYNKRVLLKPNWVCHSFKKEDELCLRTNDQFILTLLCIILKCQPLEIIIGDAPIQGCKWDDMLNNTFIDEVNRLSSEYKTSIKVKDFRCTIFDHSKKLTIANSKSDSGYITFDTGKSSFLEQVTDSKQSNFRITNYKHDRLTSVHKPGIHKYSVAKEFFDADIVISLPKIKTHQKTGITGALKNLVGINGNKDFLPHHRRGGKQYGGDCYPGKSFLRYWAELALDQANNCQGKNHFWIWKKISSIFWRLSFPGPEYNLDAGWYGNDTTWRMVMDLNLIATHGNSDGTISIVEQRKIFSMCDGIIAGQGNGPLMPNPHQLGIISFTNNPAINDIAMATLMGFDYKKIPLLMAAEKFFQAENCEIFLNSSRVTIMELLKHAVITEPPQGWKKYLIDT